MDGRSPIAVQAVEAPPSCLDGFGFSVSPVDLEYAHCIEFDLKCRMCGADVFHVLGYPIVVPDPSPYYAMEPGTVMWRPPHRLRCDGCGKTEPLFDARKNGYDAVVNNFSGYESGDEGEEVVRGTYRVHVTFAYNAELSELEESATEAKVKIADLFDWFTITCRDTNSGDVFELDYECA